MTQALFCGLAKIRIVGFLLYCIYVQLLIVESWEWNLVVASWGGPGYSWI